MIERLRITALVEDTATEGGLLAEHGLAFWIEADGHRLLFDTGQGMALRHNAEALGIDLRQADAVVLSHGHYDHSGGLVDALAGGRPAVFLHPDAIDPKYGRRKHPPHREIGIPRRCAEVLSASASSITWTGSPTEVGPGGWVTGEIPRSTSFEDTGGPFYRDPDCTEPDPLADDQAMFLDTRAGLVVVVGCAHSGVVNTLRYVAGQTDGRPIHALLGGMHLLRADRDRLDATAAAFDEYGIERLAPAHCTGSAAVRYLWARLGGRCEECSVGSRFEF